jgi:hypothetical protein
MTGLAGRSEFFAREATEYLGELDRLLGGSVAPANEAVIRLSRALRGATMLAGPAALARAAAQMEELAKRRDREAAPWSRLRDDLLEAVAEFRRLVGFARSWDEAQDHDAGALEARLRTVLSTLSPAEVPPSPPTSRSADGLRAFVAREAAAVAGTLEAAAPCLRPGTQPPDALRGIEGAMQSLRGLAGLSELAPLSDLLDAVDAAIADLRQFPTVPPGAERLARAGAEVFQRLAADIASGGGPSVHDADITQFASLLHETLVGAQGVVPIEDLVGGNGATHPAAPARRRATAMDLASLGERLQQGAAQFRAAGTEGARRLQAFVLLQAVRAAPGGLGHEPAAEFLTPLVHCLEAGPISAPDLLAELLDRAGARLVEQAADPSGLGETLRRLATNLPVPRTARVAPEGAVVPIEALAPDDVVVPISQLAPEPDVVPIELLAPEPPVVPIESLAPEPPVVAIEDLAPEPPVVPIDDLAPDPVPIETLLAELAPPPISDLVPPADRTMLERSLSHYSQLRRARAPVIPLEQLAPPAIAGGRGSRSAAVEIEAELDAVPIERLLYSGTAALDRADQVRRELEVALRVATDELDRVDPLVRELLDLVPLAFATPG